MRKGSLIQSISAREVFSDRGHPGVETTVVTEDGSVGVATVTAGVSVGKHEVQFAYDGGEKWGGLGVQKAVRIVKETIAPKLIGLDATKQREIDGIMIEMDGTPNKTKLGGNSIASVSAANLKAAAASLGLPLYQHIGGVNAFILPTPGVVALVGSDRYGGGKRAGGKPSYAFMAHGFKSFADAAYACWNTRKHYDALLEKRFKVKTLGGLMPSVPPGIVKSDREIWDVMVEGICAAGYEGKVGIQVDVAAGCYWEPDRKAFVGLFSREDKSKDDLISLYKEMVKKYPFVIMEDPLDEDDYEGHALVTKELGIEIVGDDLFTTNPERVKQGIKAGAANCVLLKVNQIGSISEAFDMVQLAYRNGYGVMPCSSRGEGADIGDYAVGLSTGHIRESGVGPSANRLMQIEQELGSRAVFLGKAGFKK